MRRVACTRHGQQSIGGLHPYIAHPVDRNERVGFFWYDEADTTRADAWCKVCEAALQALDGADSTGWFDAAEFKILCASCWDEAKQVCGDFDG